MHLENKGDKDIILQALAGSAHEPRLLLAGVFGLANQILHSDAFSPSNNRNSRNNLFQIGLGFFSAI